MRMLGGLVATMLCTIAAATPARALGDLPNCDTITDPGQRMACLQAHISHLEQTLLSLGGNIVELQHDLKEKLGATSVYKLLQVGKGLCLGFVDKDKPPMFVSCDQPDSWRLVRGSQSPAKLTTPKPADQSTDNAPPQAPDTSDKPDKPKKSKPADKQQGNLPKEPQGESSDQAKSPPQPN